MTSQAKILTFHWADYLVFGASLLISLLIGVYFAIMERRQKSSTSTDFLMAGRNAQMVPVAMSMLASFLSAIYILGVPPEVMLNGSIIAIQIGGYLLGAIIGAQVYVPVFHSMEATSVYEYLERRFNRTVRVIGSMTFVLMMLFYMAVVLYAPALAFSAVTGLTMWVTIFGIGVICTLYTALPFWMVFTFKLAICMYTIAASYFIGGMKAVIWTDTFQMVVIFVGLLALLIKGSMDVGGISRVIEISSQGRRIEFDNISIDPRERHTVWNQIFGTAFNILGLIAGNQIVIQRYLSIRKLRHAQMSIYISMLGGTVTLTLVVLLGLVIYTYYECDPISKGLKAEEIIPKFMMEILGHIHGLPGLFTASVFAASLSTVSSAVQALAAVFIQDIIHPAYLHCKKTEMSDRAKTYLAKALAMFFGLLTIGLSYLAPLLGPYLLQIALSIFGTMGGPMFGVFTLAIFFPCANSWGAAVGLLVSLALALWLNIGAIVTHVKPIPLPPRQDNCSGISNSTSIFNSTILPTSIPSSDPTSGLEEFYKVSYMWYGVISVSTTVILGLIVSALTGCRKGLPPLSKRLVFPYSDVCGCSADTCGVSEEPIEVEHNASLLWKPHPSVIQSTKL